MNIKRYHVIIAVSVIFLGFSLIGLFYCLELYSRSVVLLKRHSVSFVGFLIIVTGTIIGIVLLVFHQKNISEKLRESEEKFRVLFQESFQLIGLLDVNGTLLDVNRTALNIIGIKKPDVIGLPFWETPWMLQPESNKRIVKEAVERAADGELVRSEMDYLFSDGRRIYIDYSLKPVFNTEGDVVMLIPEGRDISERKEAEMELDRLRNYLSNIIDSMPSVLIGVDLECNITQWNKTATEQTGISPSEANGKSLAEVYPDLAGDIEAIRESIKARKVKFDLRRSFRKGNEQGYQDITIYPLVTDGVDGAVIRIDDVTELVRMEEVMVQSEKMLSVGGLAAGMAHEINNPLAGMMQSSEVVRNRLCNEEIPANRKAAEQNGITMEQIKNYMESRDIVRMLDSIRSSGVRAAEIVNNMLSFARKDDSFSSTHILKELLEKSLELAATDYDLKKQYDFKSIEIEKVYGEEPISLPCMGAKIQQVLFNILKNGAEAMHDYRRSVIESGGSPPPSRFIIRLSREPEAGMARIEIEDNGPGMDEDTRRRIFEPFFTTKEVGDGTGLGLSISYFIITENHNGTLEVESKPGEGAKFIIRLPC